MIVIVTAITIVRTVRRICIWQFYYHSAIITFLRVKGPEADADSGEILLDLLVLFSFIICEEPILLPLADVEEAEEGSLGIAELLLKLLFGILTRSTGLADNFLLALTVC